MELHPAEDIYYIVYRTYRGDRCLLEDNHFCHPGGLVECSNYSTKEIFDRKDSEFFVVVDDYSLYKEIDESVVGFVVFCDNRETIFSFGIKVSERRNGRAAEFLKALRNFRRGSGNSVRVCNTNKRDIALLQSNGYVKVGEIDREHNEMVHLFKSGTISDLNPRVTMELVKLNKERKEIQAEKKMVVSQLNKVQARIRQISRTGNFRDNQLWLFGN